MEGLFNSKQALDEYKEWLVIRDMFFGQNCVEQNIAKALGLAKACKHPDAQYLANLFAEQDVTTQADAYTIFSQQPETDARALCFGASFGIHSNVDCKNMQQAAQLGYAFAQSSMIDYLPMTNDSIQIAISAVENRERDGFFLLAHLLQLHEIHEKDNDDARKYYLIAAQLGHVKSMIGYVHCFFGRNLDGWTWSSKAAKLGDASDFLRVFCKHVRAKTSHSPEIMFVMGKTFNGNICDEQQSLFGRKMIDLSKINPAKRVVEFYKNQLAAYRAAVDTWTMIARRLGVVKDMRRMIGSMIWNAREEAEYECLENNGFKELQD